MSLVGLVLVKLGRTLNELSAITCQLVPIALKILLMAPFLPLPVCSSWSARSFWCKVQGISLNFVNAAVKVPGCSPSAEPARWQHR